MPLITKEELQKLIHEIETFKFYNDPKYLAAKEDWLSKLKPVLENYNTIPEDDNRFMTCSVINLYHLLRRINMQSTIMYASVIKEMFSLTKTIIEKDIEKEKLNADSNNDNPSANT